MSLGGSLQQRWYEDRPPPWWTLPLAALYGGVTWVRRTLYRSGVLGVQRLPVPVVVVGNLSVGGTGKTPLVIALVEALRTRGLKPGVVSRGYGGSAREPRLLDAQPDPAVAGDEPALIRLRTEGPVAIGADRVTAARLLVEAGVDVVIADDGLQHYALARDVEICVIDGDRRLGNGRLLPAGPLREREARLRGVDFVVCNGDEARAGEVPMHLELAGAAPLAEPARMLPLATFAGTRVHAVAGIGNPRRFFDALRGAGIEPVEHPFPDHHRYAPADLAFGDDLPVLMTAKDGVKCARFAAAHWFSVAVSVVLPDDFVARVIAALARRA